MARKRKAASQQQEQSGPAELDPADARKRIRSYEDVAASDDEFHLNRDKVLLDEEPSAKRRRQWAEQEDFLQPSDEEVLGYSETEDDESAEDDHDETHDGAPPQLGKGAKAGAGQSERGRKSQDFEDEDDYRWGTSKADMYGADAIETEEQALEEEAEALRLQRKQLEAMKAADYGFDEEDWQDSDAAKHAQDGTQDQDVVTEILPQLQISSDMGAGERLKLLKSRYPEFDPLSQELLRLSDVLPGLQNASSMIQVTKLRAASAYLGALTAYFALLTSTASSPSDQVIAMPANQIRDHPIMDSLMKCRELWLSVSDLSEEDFDIQSGVGDIGAEDGYDIEVDDDASVEPEVATVLQPKKTRAERFVDAQQAAADARKAERLERTEAGLADLDALLAPARSTAVKARRGNGAQAYGQESDLGEEAPLTQREAADKAKRKKSLRFYTSQIAQKANKRGAGGRNAGGDDDIPYRERLRDRQARLNAEAEKRGQRPADPETELGGESDEDDHRRAQELRGAAAHDDDDDDYYDLVAARMAKKKSEKAALAEAQRQAALEGGRVVQEEVLDPDGKRKITYAIQKNKGLTPHRKKDNRNPRVKKRKKFDEKKKKLSSMKPVYKGGEGRGGYKGELTGIKSGLVKSTKL